MIYGFPHMDLDVVTLSPHTALDPHILSAVDEVVQGPEHEVMVDLCMLQLFLKSVCCMVSKAL